MLPFVSVADLYIGRKFEYARECLPVARARVLEIAFLHANINKFNTSAVFY